MTAKSSKLKRNLMIAAVVVLVLWSFGDPLAMMTGDVIGGTARGLSILAGGK